MDEQIVQQIAQALQQGASKEDIVQALVQQGATPEQANAAVDQVMAQMGGGGQAQPQGGQGISGQEALQALQGTGVPPAQILAIMEVFLRTSQSEWEAVLQAVAQAAQGGGQGQVSQEQQPQI